MHVAYCRFFGCFAVIVILLKTCFCPFKSFSACRKAKNHFLCVHLLICFVSVLSPRIFASCATRRCFCFCKRLPFALQYAAFYNSEGNLLSCKKLPSACLKHAVWVTFCMFLCRFFACFCILFALLSRFRLPRSTVSEVVSCLTYCYVLALVSFLFVISPTAISASSALVWNNNKKPFLGLFIF